MCMDPTVKLGLTLRALKWISDRHRGLGNLRLRLRSQGGGRKSGAKGSAHGHRAAENPEASPKATYLDDRET